jgi:sugar lactone lactonase YvrE
MFDKDGKEAIFAEKVDAHGLAIDAKGNVYAADGHNKNIQLFGAHKEHKIFDAHLDGAANLVFTPDQGFVAAFDSAAFTMYSYRVEPNGDLSNAEPFYSLQYIEGEKDSAALCGAADDKGRLYISSVNGIQIFDQGGRVIGILTLPERNIVTGMAFGGANFDTLYAVTSKAVYTRKLNAKGVRSCKPPVAVAPPRM